jgi:UDP-GlcNAc:undecaprenyl-phosphate/decaprenyl-phosphate GlcNAc-1-phosphate transferase
VEYLLLTFLTSVAVVLASTPSIISVARYKNIFDLPTADKLHKSEIPRIGGLAIFAAILFGYSLWRPSLPDPSFRFVLACLLILFFVGLKDDIIGISPAKKLAAQMVVGLLIVFDGEGAVRLSGFHGFLGIYEMNYYASALISIFLFIVIINAFNLIDGIDGLATGLGLITSLVFGFWFFAVESVMMSCLAFAVSGALLGILFFNFSPAKIFIGDSGSLVIGFMAALFSLKFIEVNEMHREVLQNIGSAQKLALFPEMKDDLGQMIFNSSPAFAMAVLIVPLYDTLRVFLVRIINRRSPFKGDTNHIHHRLLFMGFNQAQTSLILFTITILFTAMSFLMKDTDVNLHILVLFLTAVFLDGVLFSLKRMKTNRLKETG